MGVEFADQAFQAQELLKALSFLLDHQPDKAQGQGLREVDRGGGQAGGDNHHVLPEYGELRSPAYRL